MSIETRSSPASAAVAVGLSALMEGFGQAYNRQPVKAAGLFMMGLTLSTASGLNTWAVRNLLGLKGTRIGPDRIHPMLLALWGGTYALNLIDAWRGANRTAGASRD